MLRHLGQAIASVADGHVTGEARERALAHLAVCPQCRAEVAGHRAMRHRLAALASPDLPSDMTARLLGLSSTSASGEGRQAADRAVLAPVTGQVPLVRPAAQAFAVRSAAGRVTARVAHGRRRVVAAGVLAAAALSTGAMIGVRAPVSSGGNGPTITPGSLELTRFDTTTRSMVLDDQGPVLAVAANH